MDCASVDCTSLTMFKNNGRSIGGGSWDSMTLSEIQQLIFIYYKIVEKLDLGLSNYTLILIE